MGGGGGGGVDRLVGWLVGSGNVMWKGIASSDEID